MSERENYHPEPYWSGVAKRIEQREKANIIAGDDEPYYRYKRKSFIKMLDEADFRNKDVLEVGCGPGGNLSLIWNKGPSRLAGIDISGDMLKLARENVVSDKIELFKTDGLRLPFKDGEFQTIMTVTVLQHNTDEEMMRSLLSEMCRCSSEKVILFEKMDSRVTGDELCKARPESIYSSICEENGFELTSRKNINIRVSYYLAGFTRKVLNSSSRQEGEPLNSLSIGLQKLFLPLTSSLDKVFTSKKDLGKLVYKRRK